MEVFVLDCGMLLVQWSHVQQAMHHACNVFSKDALDACNVKVVASTQVVDHRGDNHRSVGRDAVTEGECGVQVPDHGIEPILVALEDAALGDSVMDKAVHSIDILTRQLVA